jgi:hypothetical protein
MKQKLEKHIDGEWWTSYTEHLGHKIMVKMKEGHGAKVHIFNLTGDKVTKTFRYNFGKPESLVTKAINWLDKQLLTT